MARMLGLSKKKQDRPVTAALQKTTLVRTHSVDLEISLAWMLGRRLAEISID